MFSQTIALLLAPPPSLSVPSELLQATCLVLTRSRHVGRCCLALLLTLAASATTVHARVHTNTFNEDDAVDLRVYLGPSVRFSDFNNSDTLIWSASSLRYSTSSPELTATVSVPITADRRRAKLTTAQAGP